MRHLRPDDRIVVCGGYENAPAWLAASSGGYEGRVTRFIPGQGEQPAAVVYLNDELVLPAGAGATAGREVRGRYLVLELGHVGADWSTQLPRVHVELCDFEPEAKTWRDRRQGAWGKSHATYRVLGEGP